MMNRHLLMGWAILCSLAVLAPSDGWGQTVTKERTAVAGRFVLQLAGTSCGSLKSATGGMATADVIKESAGADKIGGKRLGPAKYEDITVQVGLDACKALYDWIKETLELRSPRKTGAIVAADFNYKEISRLEFTNALITEIGFPASDAAGKDLAYLTLKLSPERTQRKKGTGGTVSGGATAGKAEGRTWLPSNFRFEISGLDTTKVNKIDAFTVKLPVVSSSVGEARGGLIGPVKLEVPNLSFTLAESYAEPFYSWHEDFVVKGNNTQDKERTGSLIFLSPDRTKELGRLNLSNMGIFRLSPVEAPAGQEAIRRVKVEVYVEAMQFSSGK